MATKPVRKTPAIISALRTLAAQETGKRRAASLQLIAELEKQTPQVFENEAHAALACTKCLHLPCRCGTPRPPSFDDVLKTQAHRREG